MNMKEEIRTDFDRIASLKQPNWDHNRHYHNFLLQHVPARGEKMLEICCGRGEFAQLLAPKAGRVIGLDLSPEMLKSARASSNHANVQYLLQDVLEYDFTPNTFDCIASIATMHHLPLAPILEKVRVGLKPGGVFLVLDLYQVETPCEYLLSMLATPLNIALMLLKTGTFRTSPEHRQAWEEHAKHDKYLTIKEIRRMASAILPGAQVKRHFFWRYSLVWKKPQTIDNIP